MPRSNLRLYVVCPAGSGCFYNKVLEGVRKIAEELEPSNVKVEYLTTTHHNISRQIQLMAEAIDLKPDGILIMPSSSTQLNLLIDEAVDSDIPVVTVADDAPYSKRLFHVGVDNYLCGRLCGELMGNFLCYKGDVLLFSGSNELYTLKQRMLGFRDKIKSSYPEIKILKTIKYIEDEDTCIRIALDELSKAPGCNGIFATSAVGTLSVAKALDQLNLPSNPKFIGFEPNKITAEYVIQGKISAILFQSSFTQGYLSLKYLYDYLSSGIVPEKECVNTKIEIAMRENIENFI